MLRERGGYLWLQSMKKFGCVKSCMCDNLYFSVQRGIKENKKTTGFIAKEELADEVNKIVNDSDSDTERLLHKISLVETLLNINEGIIINKNQHMHFFTFIIISV